MSLDRNKDLSPGDAANRSNNALPGERRDLRDDGILLIAFSIPFVIVLVMQLVYALNWNPEDFDTAKSYPATEWLINYQGGFVRRGLPGALLFLLLEVLHLSPVVLTLLLSTGLFLIFGGYLLASLHGMAPRWLLFTTPLLGYPVYVDYILGRKDVFLLLLLALCLRLALRGSQRWWSRLLVALIMTAAVLSHEAIAFFGLPALLVMILLKSRADCGGSWFSVLRRTTRAWLWLVLPLMAIAISLHSRGTLAQGRRIIDALRFSLPPAARYLGRPGAIDWIGRPMEIFVADAHDALGTLHAGIPTWILLVALSASAIVLIASVLARRAEDVGVFFLLICLFQIVAMMPLFYLAMDHGRWLSISLLTAFILTVESTPAMRAFCASGPWRPLAEFLQAVPRSLAPIGLAFWGVPIGISSLQQILYSSPAGSMLKVYFLLRVMGLPDPSSLLGPAG